MSKNTKILLTVLLPILALLFLTAGSLMFGFYDAIKATGFNPLGCIIFLIGIGVAAFVGGIILIIMIWAD